MTPTLPRSWPGQHLWPDLQSLNLTDMRPAHLRCGHGSVLAANDARTLLAMIMIFEISLNYSLMPPLMLACGYLHSRWTAFHPEIGLHRALRSRFLAAGAEKYSNSGVATQIKDYRE